MDRTSHFHRARVNVALAALWLAACGGGGGGDNVAAAPTPAPPPAASGPATPAPAPAAPAPAMPSTTVSADTQLAVNTTYAVSTPSANTVTLTLPPTAAADDTISITGVSATPWVVAQNAGQSILTLGVNGNVVPGTVWTPRLTPRVWHWLSSDATGQVLLAGEAANGVLDTSVDGGQTWTSGNSPAGIWISSDMSATGDRMVAVQYQGGMFTSADRGVTWTRVVSSPLVNDAAGLSFESVTMSADGQHIAAVIQQGRLVLSNDAGATWTAATMPGVTSQVLPWRSVDNSADGRVIVAVAQDASVFLSTDAGATFAAVPVGLGTPIVPIFENWYRVKVSSDGQAIALVANSFGGAPGSGIWVSRNRGAAWTRGFTLTADYTALAMSADGNRIAATASNTAIGTTTTPGRVVMSTDGGGTFSALTLPGTDTDWRAIAMSSDGNKLAAATGRFNAVAPATGTGQLFTSLGNRTSVGTTGALTGNQNAGVTLRFVPGGQWVAQNATGGPFAIR